MESYCTLMYPWSVYMTFDMAFDIEKLLNYWRVCLAEAIDDVFEPISKIYVQQQSWTTSVVTY